MENYSLDNNNDTQEIRENRENENNNKNNNNDNIYNNNISNNNNNNNEITFNHEIVDLSITTTPLSDSNFNNSSDTIPLRLNKQITGDEEFMIELELNKGSNMRYYTYDEEVSNLPSDLVVQDNASKRGLTSVEALEKLVSVTNKILAEHKKHALTRKYIREFLIRPDTILTILSFLLMIAFYIYGLIKSDPYQFRLTTILVEAVLIFLLAVFNGFLYTREKKLVAVEIHERAKNIVEQLKQGGMNTIQEIKIPFVPSLTFAKVVRDGVVRNFPTPLLVEGDIVEMLYGDRAPCKMKLLSEFRDSTSPSSKILEITQVFKPTFFKKLSHQASCINNRGRYQFVLLETPWANCLKAALTQTRPLTIIMKQAEILQKVFLQRLIFLILGTGILINLFRYLLNNNDDDERNNIDQAFEILIILPIYAILPLIPLVFPILWLIVRSFANATLLVLFEALQISKTEYEDDEEVDEFDAEAPPPTKNVHIDRAELWKKFRYLSNPRDGSSLVRSTNLFESLGSTTVICSLDREGTISSPFASVDQILFPNEEVDITVLDVAEDPSTAFRVKFEDQDWDQHLSRLKPLGLNLLLNTNCGVLQGKKRADQHRKYSSFNIHAKIKPARQSCLCRLGKEIGFTDDALRPFVKRKEIFTSAPFHPSLRDRIRNDQWEVPSMDSSIYEELEVGSYQLLSDGHLEIILDNCSDYWDGQGLQSMSKEMENKIYDFYANAIVNDMQCIAYAYRPINVENGNIIPFLTSTASDSSSIYIVLPDDKIEMQEGNDDEDLSISQSVRLHRLNNGMLDANLHDFAFDQNNNTPQEEENFYQDVIQGQIFLAMATLCHQPKADVCNFIEDLKGAGIRFVYFSPTAERESKAYAERLGLETDWNSCILLSSPGDENSFGDGYLESHDIKARLPRGIDNTKNHLEDVDDIPLHVSLFAECTPESTQEMIKIFQQYGEVVCCIGSALNSRNTYSFAVADVSVAMEPTHTRVLTKNSYREVRGQSPIALGAAFAALPCGLFMHYDTSLYALTDVIREARRLINGLRMGIAFLIGTYLSMSLIILLSYCLCLPPVFTGYHILWITCVISPILAFSFLFNPHVSDTMTTMTVKNIEHLRDLPRFIIYFILRFSLLIIMSCTMFTIFLNYFITDSDSPIFGSYGKLGWLHWTNEQQWIVLYAQNLTLFAFVWYLVCISISFVNRTLSLRKFNPFRNKVLILAFIVSILLQIIFTTISLLSGPFSIFKLIPHYIYLINFLVPILIFIPIQELVKMHDMKHYTKFQKRSKLLFNTKLGMHSPV